MTDRVSRRQFLAVTGGAIGLSLVPASASAALPAAPRRLPGDRRGTDAPTTILFQGDSITDSYRDRLAHGPDVARALGTGYPLLVASELMRQRPEVEMAVYNRAVSGDRVPDLAARWDDDTLALQPTLLSVLVGVNDFWHKLLRGYSGTVADYEREFADLLGGTSARVPDVRFVILEPFVLRCGVITDQWFPEFDQRREAAARVADRLGATFIPLQAMFDDLSRAAPPAYWASDGVHPTPAGHAAIARAWMEAVAL